MLDDSLGSRLEEATRATNRITEDAGAHYNDLTNSDEYHQMAIDEATAVGIPIDFDGDVAVNVNPDFGLQF